MPKILDRFFKKPAKYAEAFEAMYDDYMSSTPSAFMHGHTALKGDTENYVNRRLRESVDGTTGQLSRVFDHIEIPAAVLAQAYKEANIASQNGTIEEHLNAVIKDTATYFLNADLTALNDRAIAAINQVNIDRPGVETYQTLVDHFKRSIPRDSTADKEHLAKQAVANLFMQGIAVGYAQKLVDHNSRSHSGNRDYYHRVISPMQAYAGKITGPSLLAPHVKSQTAEDLMPAIKQLDQVTNTRLDACIEYKQFLIRKGIQIVSLNVAIKNMQRKIDDIDTVFEMIKEGVPTVDKINKLLIENPKPEESEAMALVKSYQKVGAAISNITEYLNHLAKNDAIEYQTMKPFIQQAFDTLTHMKIHPTEFSPSQVDDAIRNLDIVTMAEYHHDRQALIALNDPTRQDEMDQLDEIIGVKTMALILREKENVKPTNHTTSFKERYQAQKERDLIEAEAPAIASDSDNDNDSEKSNSFD